MDIHTATEVAYKNGYAAGKKESEMSKNKKKIKDGVIEVTPEQLEQLIKTAVKAKEDSIKKVILKDALNEFFTLALLLPGKVLKEHYWSKTFEKKLPEFADHVHEYYDRWNKGEFTSGELMDELFNMSLAEMIDKIIYRDMEVKKIEGQS